MTREEFKVRFGVEPQQDDLARAACTCAGATGHFHCGVCPLHEKPRFMCGCSLVVEIKKHEEG